MSRPIALLLPALLLACSSKPSPPPVDAGNFEVPAPPWLLNAHILVSGTSGSAITNRDCRNAICRHNENTDLVRWKGDIYFVHRTAISQVLGPNSALHVYRSTDEGASFTQTALLPAPTDRDIRDPHFYIVGGELYIKTITRLPPPGNPPRDLNVDSLTQYTRSSDGITWAPLVPIGPHQWSFWRIQPSNGVYYSAAYQDGDQSVVLYSSTDGVKWTAGAPIYTVAADTPLETELTFMPSGRMLALVRMDGTDAELAGGQGRLRTKVCWAMPPYTSFSCPQELTGQRLDGPLSFFWQSRLFVVARKHLSTGTRKRTALFEITASPGGSLDGGPLSVREWGELPSVGDTAYAGGVASGDHKVVVTWYSSDLSDDESWVLGLFDASDIWEATIDFSLLK